MLWARVTGSGASRLARRAVLPDHHAAGVGGTGHGAKYSRATHRGKEDDVDGWLKAFRGSDRPGEVSGASALDAKAQLSRTLLEFRQVLTHPGALLG